MSVQDTTQNSVIAQWGNFVTYAYQMYAEGGLTPPPPAALAAGWDLLGYVNALDLGGQAVNYGFVAREKNGTTIVIAVRGTEGWREWVSDADFPQVPFNLPNSGQVEQGFFGIFKSMWYQPAGSSGKLPLRDGILAAIGTGRPAVNLAAHSLGTVLATMLAATLVSGTGGLAPAQLACYLLAPPKAGDKAFANFYGGLGLANNTWRVAYQPDVVPACPPSIGDWIYHEVPANAVPLPYRFEVVLSLGCDHSLTTYLWLLDSNHFALAPGCDWFAAAKPAPASVPA